MLKFAYLWYYLFTLEKIDDDISGLLNSRVLRVDNEIGLGRYVIILINTGETLNDTLTRFLIEPFDVTSFADLERRVDKYFEERQIGVLVNFSCHFPVRRERRHEAAEGNDASIRKESRDLSNATYILLAIFFAEAEITVQTSTYVVTIQAIRGNSLFQKQY